MEEACVARDPHIPRHVQVDNNFDGRGRASERAGSRSEVNTVVYGNIERGAGSSVENGVVQLIGRDDAVGAEATNSSESVGVARDPSAVGTAPEDSVAISREGNLSAIVVIRSTIILRPSSTGIGRYSNLLRSVCGRVTKTDKVCGLKVTV